MKNRSVSPRPPHLRACLEGEGIPRNHVGIPTQRGFYTWTIPEALLIMEALQEWDARRKVAAEPTETPTQAPAPEIA